MSMWTMMTFRYGASRKATTGRGQPRSAFGRPLAVGVALSVLLAGLSGCVSAGGGPVSENFWREDLGRLNQATLEVGLAKILQKHGLRLDRQYETGRDIRWELNWVPREIVAEEEVRGVTNARNRIVIRGVESGLGEVDFYRMTWELQNEVTSMADQNWHPDVVPASVKDEFQPVYTDLMLEVRTGVRR